MKITELIIQPEGRRLEFKAKLPAVSDIAKTIVAFANDAGGELFIGIIPLRVKILRLLSMTTWLRLQVPESSCPR